jgi:ABC-type sugar transport system permease subunit
MRASPLTLTRKQWEPLAFASPALVLIAIVILFPLVYSFYLSLQNFDLSVGPEREFVGLQNYTEALFRDERFVASIWNTAVIIAPSLVFELLRGLGIALLLAPKDALDTAAKEWDKITDRRGRDKQRAFWGEKLAEMKALGIEYRPDWAAKAK